MIERIEADHLKALIADARRGEPHPALTALVSFGVTTATIAEALGVGPGNMSSFINGSKDLPKKHKPAVVAMLREAVPMVEARIQELMEGRGPAYEALRESIMTDNSVPDGHKEGSIIHGAELLQRRYVERIQKAQAVLFYIDQGREY